MSWHLCSTPSANFVGKLAVAANGRFYSPSAQSPSFGFAIIFVPRDTVANIQHHRTGFLSILKQCRFCDRFRVVQWLTGHAFDLLDERRDIDKDERCGSVDYLAC